MRCEMNAARLAIANIFLLGLGLVALELGFGSWIRDNRIRSLNLITDELYVHDVAGLYDHGGRGVVYRRDAHGLRGAYHSPAEIGILTVGGTHAPWNPTIWGRAPPDPDRQGMDVRHSFL